MSKKQKKMLYRIIIASVLMIAFHFLPFEGIPRFLCYMIPYFIISANPQDICLESRVLKVSVSHITRDG